MNTKDFINKIGAMAREDMEKTGILASLTVAQAILESGWGSSGLTIAANNLFGIKGSYNGASYSCETKEWDGEKYITVIAAFKKYPSWAESLEDHSTLFNTKDRYKNLRGCTDYKLACRYVREDGYATDPEYTGKLINLIESYNLTQFDIAAKPQAPSQPSQNVPTGIKTGDIVQFNGGNVYVSSNAPTAATVKGESICKVTNTYNGKHPYHLISSDGKGVYGWVDADCIGTNTATEMREGAKVQYSGVLYADSYGGGAGSTVNGTYSVSRYITNRKCGVLLNNGLGWVPESACKIIA